MNDDIQIIPLSDEYCESAVMMWRESKEKALGIKDKHSFTEHKKFLDNILRKNYEVFIAIEKNEVAGLIAFNETEVNQLYIHNNYQNRGIGKTLLDIAKSYSKEKLTLFTFEINKKAQRFYERNGFTIIARGNVNEENLDDIKYEWRKPCQR